MLHYCGRTCTSSDIELIRTLLAVTPPLTRARLSREVCERLNWRRADGRLKDMSCRVALLRMQTDGLITLPPPRNAKPVPYRAHPDIEHAVLEPVTAPAVDLARLSVDLVGAKRDSLLWNTYIQRYHYLGHKLMPGAQLRYFVRAAGAVIALLSFGASAWKTKPRDEFIGWTHEQRPRNLHLIVNNARFLILPWITCRNLASRTLSLISRRLPEDWHTRYAYRPVLLETFVEKPRFAGTCYKAANWQYLGDTQGRGKLDRLHRNAEPVKSVWVYPLVSDFRRHLCNT
ncbi:MAG: Druantia anti-phage system protein DruA [Steroidobacteraceae bacterium]